ncbi:MAG: isoprenylcysteine carboxylmethyltransferase family protein [Bacteroidales bacterium]|nr:isoprenylcysteine carboxylmethyltransferase family protein [Bacteroidales bacterium]
MKAKIFSIAIFFLLAYLLPLNGNLELLFTLQVGILVVFVIVLFATQPPVSITETKEDQSSDKNSIVFILLGYLLGQMATAVEWGYFSEYRDWTWDWPTILGLSLMVAGTAFRIWCIHTLGRFFTATVKTQENQRVITSGAYHLVRHPSYSGAYIAAVGSSIFMHAFVAAVFTFIILFIAYYIRIKAEEETLVKEFGEEYIAYRKRTNKLVPWVY